MKKGLKTVSHKSSALFWSGAMPSRALLLIYSVDIPGQFCGVWSRRHTGKRSDYFISHPKTSTALGEGHRQRVPRIGACQRNVGSSIADDIADQLHGLRMSGQGGRSP